MSVREKVAVIGSYAVGMTMSTERFPTEGETVLGSNFQMHYGGKGSNQAVAAARMGADVLYGGCLGKDSFGDMALELYDKEDMNVTYVRRSTTGASTGVGLVIVNAHGENEIVIDFAANNEVGPEDIDNMMPDIKKCRYLLMQLEINIDTVIYAAKRCKEENVRFILNPAPYHDLPKEIYSYCDYLTPNETEAKSILGLKKEEPVSQMEVAKRIYALGVKNVIITLGGKGALIYNNEIQEVIEGIKVLAVDTTGAGDTFNGALMVGLAEGKTIQEAVRFGNAAAALSVTVEGVVPSIPYRNQVEELL